MIGGAGRGGWARRGASCQPTASRSAPARVQSARTPRPPDPPGRAGADRLPRAWRLESVRLVPMIDLRRSALPSRAPRCQLPGASLGKAGAPEGF